MADGVGYTEGSGTTIATDDAGASGQVQIIKLAISSDGSATVIPADATYGLDVDVTRVGTITPGTAATSLGKAEDAAHSSGDTGVAVWAVRDDTAGAFSGADGDYEPLHTDDSGNLRVLASINDGSDGAAVPGSDIEVTATPTVDTSAYADGDNLATAIISLANATQTSGGYAWTAHMWVLDKAGHVGGTATPNVGLEVYILNASLTPNTANAAFNLSDTDGAKIRQVLSTADGTTYDYGGGTFTTIDAGRARGFKLASGTTAYAVAKVLDPDADTPTWAASDITIGFYLMRD